MRIQKTDIQTFFTDKCLVSTINAPGADIIRRWFRVKKCRGGMFGFPDKTHYRIHVETLGLHHSQTAPFREQTGYGIGLGGYQKDEDAVALFKRLKEHGYAEV